MSFAFYFSINSTDVSIMYCIQQSYPRFTKVWQAAEFGSVLGWVFFALL